MTVRQRGVAGEFWQLAAALSAEPRGGYAGWSFAAACPACAGRLLVWTHRPGPWPRSAPGWRCADCGRSGSLLDLALLLRVRA
jgi:hypothetical protein